MRDKDGKERRGNRATAAKRMNIAQGFGLQFEELRYAASVQVNTAPRAPLQSSIKL